MKFNREMMGCYVGVRSSWAKCSCNCCNFILCFEKKKEGREEMKDRKNKIYKGSTEEREKRNKQNIRDSS